MLTKRVIPCLDVRNGLVTKGVKFKDNVDLGDPVEMAVRYSDGGADELVFYDITASAKRRHRRARRGHQRWRFRPRRGEKGHRPRQGNP